MGRASASREAGDSSYDVQPERDALVVGKPPLLTFP